MIELQHVNKSFGNFQALKDIHLFIQEGEIFGIIGQSGAGKSTLLRMMNLLERPDTGEVWVDHQNLMGLNRVKLRSARHKIGMIFQQFNLVSGKTVFENIALPMKIQKHSKNNIQVKVEDLLKLVGLEEKKTAYPAKLSGGQKQRVAIARALATSPKILLCDEATSALDPETTEQILNLLQKIQQLFGITIVFITHQHTVIQRICHRLALMENGYIQEVTPVKDIFSNPNTKIKALFYEQLSPTLPAYLESRLSQTPSNHVILKLFFQGAPATSPFISQTSRALNLDVNILLATIDAFDGTTCGILMIEVHAAPTLQKEFIDRAHEAGLFVETLGYVNSPIH